MATLIEQLMQQLANRPGADIGQQAVQQAGPMGGMYQVDRQRREGSLTGPDAAIADRFAEGRAMKERFGPLLGPAAAITGAAGYEGIAKPILNALPGPVAQMVPEGFRPNALTSPAGGREALLRVLATAFGSTSR